MQLIQTPHVLQSTSTASGAYSPWRSEGDLAGGSLPSFLHALTELIIA